MTVPSRARRSADRSSTSWGDAHESVPGSRPSRSRPARGPTARGSPGRQRDRRSGAAPHRCRPDLAGLREHMSTHLAGLPCLTHVLTGDERAAHWAPAVPDLTRHVHAQQVSSVPESLEAAVRLLTREPWLELPRPGASFCRTATCPTGSLCCISPTTPSRTAPTSSHCRKPCSAHPCAPAGSQRSRGTAPRPTDLVGPRHRPRARGACTGRARHVHDPCAGGHMARSTLHCGRRSKKVTASSRHRGRHPAATAEARSA